MAVNSEAPSYPGLCLFLGAGASADASVPTTAEFVTEFRKTLANSGDVEPYKSLLATYDALVGRLSHWLARQTPGKAPPVDIELLLQALEIASHPETEVLSALVDSSVVRVGDPVQLLELGRRLRGFVRERCVVTPERTDYLEGLLPLLTTSPGVPIFSVNYDLVIEHFLYRHRLSYADGIDLKWNPESLRSTKADAYLYKLHGSVNWYRTVDQSYFKLPIFLTESNPKLLTGELAEEFLLYPDQKWAYSGPAWDLLGVLRQHLSHAEWFIVIGYSFRDYHFVRMFLEAGLQNPRLRIVLVGPSADTVAKTLTRVSPPDDPFTQVPSRLDGRVFAIPFRFGRIIDGFYFGRFADLSSAVRNYEVVRDAKARGGTPQWERTAMELASASVIELMDQLETADPGFAGAQSPLWVTEYRLKRTIAECIHRRPNWKDTLDEALTDWAQMMGAAVVPDKGSLPRSVKICFEKLGSAGPEAGGGPGSALLPSQAAEPLSRAIQAAAAGLKGLDRKYPSDEARFQELSDIVVRLAKFRSYFDDLPVNGFSPALYCRRAGAGLPPADVESLAELLDDMDRVENAPSFDTNLLELRRFIRAGEVHLMDASLEVALRGLKHE